MFATLLTIALFAISAIPGVLGDFTISTPQNVAEGGSVHITWAGGKAPYNLIAVPASNPCDDMLVDLGDHNGTSMTWTNTLPAGTAFVLSLQDTNEDEAWSGTITVSTNSTSSATSTTSTTSAATTSPTTAGSISTGSSGSGSSVSGSSGSSSGSSSSSSPLGAVGADPLTGDSGAIANHLSLPVLILSAFVAASVLL